MGIAPLEPVAGSDAAGSVLPGSTASEAPAEPASALDPGLLDELWDGCGARAWELERADFERILHAAGAAQNFGVAGGAAATARDQREFFRALRLDDLVLAHACAEGSERAWQHFMTAYREPLKRAAISIAGNETLGRELADQLYAELYGLTERDGKRRCPLLSYRGRGSLIGWLRTTLAQQHVDRYRSTRREQPLDEIDAPAPEIEPIAVEASALARAVEAAIASRQAEERYLLAAYYLDGQTLLGIARVLGVHEATASRKLHRVLGETRKQVLRHLEQQGLSRRAAREALGADPRDLDVNLKNLLQQSQANPFPEKGE